METKPQNLESFDENQSIRVIKEMIQVSQKKLKNDGVLFILWGWTMFYNYFSSFVLRNVLTTYQVERGLSYFGTGLGIFAIVFSIYYIFRNSKKVTTYIGISLRYVWVSLIVCLSLTNMILFHGLNEFNVEVQHPIYMLFIANAIVITGGILRYRLLIFGGIVFGVLAYTASYLTIEWQILCEAIAWLIAFVIPGHILYADRNK